MLGNVSYHLVSVSSAFMSRQLLKVPCFGQENRVSECGCLRSPAGLLGLSSPRVSYTGVLPKTKKDNCRELSAAPMHSTRQLGLQVVFKGLEFTK